jgi:hypothetical protein
MPHEVFRTFPFGVVCGCGALIRGEEAVRHVAEVIRTIQYLPLSPPAVTGESDLTGTDTSQRHGDTAQCFSGEYASIRSIGKMNARFTLHWTFLDSRKTLHQRHVSN